jgi:Flp pilus assembly protein TadD
VSKTTPIFPSLATLRQSLMVLLERAGESGPLADAVRHSLAELEQVGEQLDKRRERERLAALYEVSQALGASLQLDEVLNQVMDAVIQLTSAGRGFLVLLREDGELDLRAGQPELAIHEFLQAVRSNPMNIQAWNGLAVAYVRVGSLDDAQRAIEKAEALDPNSPYTRTNRGLLAASQHQWDEARRVWEGVLAQKPDFGPAAENLQQLNRQQTQPSRSAP